MMSEEPDWLDLLEKSKAAGFLLDGDGTRDSSSEIVVPQAISTIPHEVEHANSGRSDEQSSTDRKCENETSDTCVEMRGGNNNMRSPGELQAIILGVRGWAAKRNSELKERVRILNDIQDIKLLARLFELRTYL